jgi:hypothetical protein
MNRSLLIALLILALCFAINPRVTERTALRAAVWTCVRNIIHAVSVHGR